MWPGKALGFTLFLRRSSVRPVICAPGGTSAGFGPHGILSEACLQGPGPLLNLPPRLDGCPPVLEGVDPLSCLSCGTVLAWQLIKDFN